MTNTTTAPLGNLPAPKTLTPLFALVRLLAREAARAEFATRCNSQNGEVDHD